MSNPSIIKIQAVTKSLEQKEIIRSCNLSINEGAIYGLLGLMVQEKQPFLNY